MMQLLRDIGNVSWKRQEKILEKVNSTPSSLLLAKYSSWSFNIMLKKSLRFAKRLKKNKEMRRALLKSNLTGNSKHSNSKNTKKEVT